MIDLSSFCTSGGCGAKLDPRVLSDVLQFVPKKDDPNLLVGFDSSDDGAVYKLTEDVSIINTLDFFTPIVEEPYTFGQIAATNALSDVYAMGGEPKVCLNIVSFPKDLSPNILIEILKGGADKVIEAGAVLSGGHTINDVSLKYGLSVTGIVNTNKIMKNNNCQIGDKIILTKPLGVGIIMAANKIKDCKEEHYKACVKSMVTLNNHLDILSKYKINSVTDVTGFGFLGHLNEMVKDNSIHLNFKNILFLDGAMDYSKEFYFTEAGQKNRNNLKGKIKSNLELYEEELLYDPQTSGGLLISVDSKDCVKLLDELTNSGVKASCVGEVGTKDDFNIYV